MNNFIRHLATTSSIGFVLLVGVACTVSTSSSKAKYVPSAQIDNYLNPLEPGEVCVINETEAEAEKLDEFAQTQGYTRKKRRSLEGLGFVMSIFNVPEGQSAQEGIVAFRQEFPSEIIDANHHYYLQGPETHLDSYRYGHDLIGWNEEALSCTTQDIHIGIIDTSVNASHLHLPHQAIHTQSFISDTTPKAPQNHGTAVATLLVGQTSKTNSALLPRATLRVAEAFRQTKSGRIEATTWSIVRALDWLVKENVDVINLSLGGPKNALLTYAVDQTLSHKIPIIAAAGNTGPRSSSVYPAAQEGVIAVTALDAKLHPYSFANRGSYITFSAPGVDIWIPEGADHGAFKSGTSFATPFVTTAAAAIKQIHPDWTPDQVARHLAKDALDLGTDGKDDTYGWGLIQIPQTCSEKHRSIQTQS